MPEIRLLNIDKDMDVIKTAWGWRDTAPRWFRELLDVYKEPWSEYVENFPNELHYGVFTDGEPQAIVRLIEAHPWIYNLHLSAKRKTNFGVLVQAGLSLRDYLFDQGIHGFYGNIATINRGVCKLYEALGFIDTGRRTVKGTIHGKDVVWKQYSLVSPLFIAKYGKMT